MAKMKLNDLESEVRSLKLIHASESELASYCDQELDQFNRARVEAHVKQCFICKRELELLGEERAALNDRLTTTEDEAFVGRLINTIQQENEHSEPANKARLNTVRERMAEYSSDLSASWRIKFAHAQRSAHNAEVWQWQSVDGKLGAKATIQKNADLIIRISSVDVELEGARLRFSLGLLNQELTLEKVSESLVGAQVAVPARYRQGNMAEIRIELIQHQSNPST